MKKTGRLLAAALGIMLAAGSLGGCGKKAEPAPATKAEAASADTSNQASSEKQTSEEQTTAEVKESKGGGS